MQRLKIYITKCTELCTSTYLGYVYTQFIRSRTYTSSSRIMRLCDRVKKRVIYSLAHN